MPFKEWATSLKSSRRGSLDPSTRCISTSSLPNMGVNESERSTLDGGTLEVQDLHLCAANRQHRSLSVMSSATASPRSLSQSNSRPKHAGSIERRVDYFVVEDDRYTVRFGNYTGVWAGNAGRSVPQTRSRYFGDHIHQLAYHTNKV